LLLLLLLLHALVAERPAAGWHQGFWCASQQQQHPGQLGGVGAAPVVAHFLAARFPILLALNKVGQTAAAAAAAAVEVTAAMAAAASYCAIELPRVQLMWRGSESSFCYMMCDTQQLEGKQRGSQRQQQGQQPVFSGTVVMLVLFVLPL
jgi:hypothetical protein